MNRPFEILVAEDQHSFRNALLAELSRQSDLLTVGQARTGLEAVRPAHKLKPDLILLAIDLPVLDGLSAARLISCGLPQTKIVITATSEAPASHLAAIQAGAHGYVQRSLPLARLPEILRSMLREEGPFSTIMARQLAAKLHPDPGAGAGARARTGTGSEVRAAAQTGARSGALSRRELEILHLVARGLANREIARRLVITEGAAKNHVNAALKKLRLNHRGQVAAYVIRRDLD